MWPVRCGCAARRVRFFQGGCHAQGECAFLGVAEGDLFARRQGDIEVDGAGLRLTVERHLARFGHSTLPAGSRQSKVASITPESLPPDRLLIFASTMRPNLPPRVSLPQKSNPFTSPCANHRPR
jgi:hypothetical protein